MIYFKQFKALKKNKIHPPLLFIHGAWHSSWCWEENFVPYFQKAGYDVYTMDLRGHGKSPNQNGKFRWNSIRNYVQDVEEVIKKLPQFPILIGHSMGGLIVQKILEKNHVSKAVLLASVPPHGVFRITLELLIRHPIRFLKVLLTLSLFPIVEDTKLGSELFFSESLDKQKAIQFASKTQDESFLAFLDMLIFSLPKSDQIQTPLLVLGGEKDRFFVPWEVKRTANTYQSEMDIFQGMGHNLMLDEGWEKVAERIHTYLNGSKIDLEKKKNETFVSKKKNITKQKSVKLKNKSKKQKN
ncbi:putative lysophospholipase [Leptospira interrogans serovar Autumnalis str. LP101]|uniref:alpha/beta hydrolase n=1 Tax=Leptospira interrogans TaxID=173 RepID=UPI0002BEE536|nr:alpha/beta hydrolase [Leptospira interrogans]EMN51847.1 putative lysophospholipase [Leptospira interrogans serovar Autumnalis str. LP101]